MDRSLKYRDLLKILKRFGVWEDARRGKGSERMLCRAIRGRELRYPTKCHNEGDEKPKAVVRAIRRALGLTAEDGVSDEQFYGKKAGKERR